MILNSKSYEFQGILALSTTLMDFTNRFRGVPLRKFDTILLVRRRSFCFLALPSTRR